MHDYGFDGHLEKLTYKLSRTMIAVHNRDQPEIYENKVAIETDVQVASSAIKCLFPSTKSPWAKYYYTFELTSITLCKLVQVGDISSDDFCSYF